jgi:nucleoside-diphosphate-sugar epimerase
LSGETVAATLGEQHLDMVYVDDVVDGLVAATGLAGGERAPRVYALASGRCVTLRQLAALIEQATGRALKMEWGKLPYREGQIFDPVTTLPPLPGWQPKTPLEDGLRRVVLESTE